MAIRASTQPGRGKAISFPFIWQDSNGTVWMRVAGPSDYDICLVPGASNTPIGTKTNTATLDSAAWLLRYKGVVELSNE